MTEPRFAVGDRVQVIIDWPERRPQPSGVPSAHIRTPHFVRGQRGTVARVLGNFANPEDLAFARPAPKRALYQILFDQRRIWPECPPGDSLLVEIFDHWLEPAQPEEQAA